MIIVGICGASGSGKSTLAKEIEDSLTCTSAIIGLDCYYRDHSDLPFEERVHIKTSRIYLTLTSFMPTYSVCKAAFP